MDKNVKRSLRHGLRSPRRQRGVVVVLVAAGMLAIIAMAGLALDLGDSYLSKTRLHNALDTAALSGAKTLLDGGGTAEAETDAIATFNLDPRMANAALTPVIEFSDTLVPFNPGAPDDIAKYVRASVASYPRDAWFAAVLGITDRAVAGTAVAGPIPVGGCTEPVLPVVICAKDPEGECNDETCFGYPVGAEDELCLKAGSPGGGPTGCNAFDVGTGNFQLLDLGCPKGGGGGAACVAKNLAGGYSQCVAAGDTETVESKPGNSVGPTVKGINTRFGEYTGGAFGLNPTDHPPDVVTHSDPAFWFSSPASNAYKDWLADPSKHDYPENEIPPGKKKRRVVAVPIGKCVDGEHGVTDIEMKKIACFYLTKKSTQGGGPDSAEIYGQLIETSECPVNGRAVNDDDEEVDLPPKIVLFKDPDTRDS